MAWQLSTAARNAALDAVVDLIDGGAGPGTMQIRTGTPPGITNAVTGTLLATVTCADPAFGSSSAGAAALGDPAGVTVAATGTAGYVRILDSTGAAVLEGTVTATGGGGDLTLATTSLVSGATVDITGGTLTQPAGG